MIRSPLKLPTEGSPFSASRRQFEIDVTPDRAGDVAAALRDLVGQLPDHPAIVPIRDAGVAQGRPFTVSAPVDGEPLDAALAAYGPADSADALPRLRRLADALDFAAASGWWHGALTPQDIIVSTDETWLTNVGVVPRLEFCGVFRARDLSYTAPEVLQGRRSSPAADQYALAAIAYEWLFGRAVAGPVDGVVDVPHVPGLDEQRLSSAFASALAADPEARFANCTAFVAALEASRAGADVVDLPVRPASATFVADDLPIYPGDEQRPFDRLHDEVDADVEGSRADDPHAGLLDPITSRIEPPLSSPPAAGGLERREANSAKGVALAAIVIVGLGIGAGLWLAGEDAVGDRAAEQPQAQPFTEAAVGPETAVDPAPPSGSDTTNVPAPADTAPGRAQPSATEQSTPREPLTAPAPKVPVEQRAESTPPPPRSTPPVADAMRAAHVEAGLLIHSMPAGASVTIDGVERGITPVAVRGLALGTRQVVISHGGYRTAHRQVTLTPDRPSRTLEVELLSAARVSPPAAARTGELVVDSRPAGARISINGRAAGSTPLHIRDLAAGSYQVTIQHPGYRAVMTRVEVTPGQRARVAARLEGEQEYE